MGYAFSTPAGLIALFAMVTQVAIAVVLAFSSGLSELHKDLMVGFALGFPAVMLVVILVLLVRAQGTDLTLLEEQ